MLRTLDSLGDLAGTRVVVRCDLNVPLKDGEITDDGRVRASVPTLDRLLGAGASVTVLSHLGRPDGAPNPRYSLEPVAKRLGELLDREVEFVPGTAGEAEPGSGAVTVLENLRFDPRETSKDAGERREYAEALARHGSAFVSDGFGVVHRKQASVYELAQVLPSAAGLLIADELSVLERLTERPEKPYAVVLGGSKVSDKLGVIDHLLPRVDALLIGGGMLFTFLAAKGFAVGRSLLEQDQIPRVQEYLQRAESLGVTLLVPTDVVVAAAFAADADHETVAADAIESSAFGADGIGLDIGPDTAEAFAGVIARSRTVFWNGPMGVFEFPAFASGTKRVAEALTEVDGLSVVGGGDSAAAVRSLGFGDDRFGHISTGGGASLEFLEGKDLPGLQVLGWERDA
ncbi:phosphoglycerate kinase [uncultured Amnibacterium sp.]|uniref:phosphoglycerate kinase n=1 Tax=uncultured Amnibacterium sp. TaxID=1631851 RepID=UPI0035C943F9